jgi:tetratricopeptide (TPR) repeat protein
MHRSGTSCLAGMLQLAGFAAGTVNDYAPNNRRGNREDPAIVALNDRVLRANGADWDDPPPIDTPLWFDEPHRRSRMSLLEAAATHDRPWMFKDPRTLLTLPLWREALPNPRRLGIFRHPLRVAQSLYYRAQGQQAIARGLALWTRYNEALLREHERAAFPLVCFDVSGAEFIAAVAQALHNECGDLVDAGRIDLVPLADFYDADELHQQHLLDAEALGDDPDARAALARAMALYERLRQIAGIDAARIEPAATAALRAEYAQLQAVDAAVRAGDLPSALARCRALAGASPNRAQLWWRMVQIAKTRKDDAALVDVCREAVAGLPDDPGMRLELAGALRQSGQPALALGAVDEALALRPGWGQAQLMRGVALNALGRSGEAVEAFRAGSVKGSENPWLMTPYAVALLRAGQQEEAAEAFHKALVRNPQSTHALIHQQWAQALAATGRLDAASAQFELAMAAAGPRRAEFAQAFARLLQRHGRDQEARHWLASVG